MDINKSAFFVCKWYCSGETNSLCFRNVCCCCFFVVFLNKMNSTKLQINLKIYDKNYIQYMYLKKLQKMSKTQQIKVKTVHIK